MEARKSGEECYKNKIKPRNRHGVKREESVVLSVSDKKKKISFSRFYTVFSAFIRESESNSYIITIRPLRKGSKSIKELS